jgi:hypothetical protein
MPKENAAGYRRATSWYTEAGMLRVEEILDLLA